MGEEFTAFAPFSSLASQNALIGWTADLFWYLKTTNVALGKQRNWENNMEANAGMVAGSYKRNELVRIRHDSDSGVSVLDVPCSDLSPKKSFVFV